MSDELVTRLQGLGLLKPDFREKLADESFAGMPHVALMRLCDLGALQGGLSIALDVRADELFGPLVIGLGGKAAKLRLLDVRETKNGKGDPDALELEVQLGELNERWRIEDLYALIHNVNDLFRRDEGVKFAAVLGEWEDLLHLVCLPRKLARSLLREPFFSPRNRYDLDVDRRE